MKDNIQWLASGLTVGLTIAYIAVHLALKSVGI